MKREAPVNLCSPDSPRPPRASKRRREGAFAAAAAPAAQQEIIDLCPDMKGAESSCAQEHVSRQCSRGLWGEIEHEALDMPQRWGTARRRTPVPPPLARDSLPIELPDSPVPSRVTHSQVRSHRLSAHSDSSEMLSNRRDGVAPVPTRSSRQYAPSRHQEPAGYRAQHAVPEPGMSQEEQRAAMDECMARQLQEQEDAALAQRHQHHLSMRQPRLDPHRHEQFDRSGALSAADQGPAPWELPPQRHATSSAALRRPHLAAPADAALASWRARHLPAALPTRQPRAGGQRRRGWPAPTLTHTVMAMLAENGALGPASTGERPSMRHTFQAMLAAHPHIAAMHEAFAGMGNNQLPAHLLLSDRDFDENDYEALLALDDSVENRKGATAEAIAAIPTRVAGMSAEAECKCPICLENFDRGVTLRDLPCGHHFHQECLDQWLQQKATCPICQRSYK
ncbi:hypothetical protein WJX74_007137 [Apatococcus lobatus]|uniref:RING-type domain-containing protein n=1 Tax=Apatococcus lobatus TaxID=904363 RepID=A0AAW1RHQ4_9CHLO